MKIIPAILTDNNEEFRRMLYLSSMFCDYVQVDVMDGEFVPSHSVGAGVLDSCPAGLEMEIHLMVQHPGKFIDRYNRPGVRRIIVHYESIGDSKIYLEKIRDLGLSPGLAVNPETPVDLITDLFPYLDLVMVMTVNPGFYGSTFLPDMLGKVKKLVDLRGDFEISVDGGIKLSNLEKVKLSGVDAACVGSAIFQSEDPGATYENFVKLAFS